MLSNNHKYSDILLKYLHDLDQIPQITPEEEIALARQIKKGDKQALHKLVRSNLKFVVYIAREYEERGLPLDELISEGNLGLLEAANRFDPDRGYKFISYAVWWIRQSILRALAKYSRLVRVPINRTWILQKMTAVVSALEQDLGRTPALEEVAEELDMPVEELMENLAYLKHEVFLEDSTRPFDDNLSLIEKISSEEFGAPSSGLIQESMKTDIRLALESLRPIEAEVLKKYFGIDQERPLTLLEIGDEMNLSRERIRQIKNKALRRLQYFHRREKLRYYLDEMK
ncbi:MAG: RNA polymerase sigma factor RpoD/SigA [candidate division KSB1 bacterium]|nr:RNA polymerase sigma factor RpoD/SigA [candidate division KSB1 bacterium]MDZ7358063.1 RNA polymerase sigma factor RpoD/SigA [candidate division KSB1 bacterium]MDZ7402234.1 RNA polymerase sigma factor RpoD/SigA [candidate division KSB1 bacterium]